MGPAADRAVALNVACPEPEPWRRILDALPFLAVLVDDEHSVVAVNEAARREFCSDRVDRDHCPSLHRGLECPLQRLVIEQVDGETEFLDEKSGRWLTSAVYPTSLLTFDGRPVHLLLARDISQEKHAARELERSLEHHKALARLLQELQRASTPESTLQLLIDLALGLSWMGATSGAAAFVRRGGALELAACRNLEAAVSEQCARVPLGECLCGAVAQSQTVVITAPDETLTGMRVPHPVASHGHAVFPLLYEGRALGVVNFYLRPGCEFEPSQRYFLDAAVGVAAAALAEQLARSAAREAREQAAALERKLLERVLASQEEERKRVARELHDDLGQSLSALLLELKSTTDDTPSRLVRSNMERAVRGLVEKVHRLAWDLRPSLLDDYGLDSALERHVATVEQRSGLPIDYRFVQMDEIGARLPQTIELVLYRVTQEALNNAVRHARASRASVVVLRRTSEVILLVEDDGWGFDPSSVRATEASGLGITSIKERIALIRGKVSIDSDRSSGTSLRVWVPLDGTKAEPSQASPA